MEERWKPIYGSKFYDISSEGNVRINDAIGMRKDGKSYHVKSQPKKPYTTKCGYSIVSLGWDVPGRYLVHRLVMEMFNPKDGMEHLQVNHIDGVKSHNSLSNLEWATREENMQHAMRTGLWTPLYASETNPNTKLHKEEIDRIREMLQEGKTSQHEIAKQFGVSDTVVSDIKRRVKRFKEI